MCSMILSAAASQISTRKAKWVLVFTGKVSTRLALALRYLYPMLLRSVRSRPNGFIEPCLPTPASKPPAGDGWIHEIKHDGFRLMARRDAGGVRLLTRRGFDWT